MEMAPAMPLEHHLRQRFHDLAISLNSSFQHAQTWANAFIAHYTESHRYYHTLSHIDAMVTCLDNSRSLVRNSTAVELAIFFHDWIYYPRSSINEVESINAFKNFAKGISLDEKSELKIELLIERTITHTLPDQKMDEQDKDLELFLDFDLEVLSRSRDNFELYTWQIRQEYISYNGEDYRIGRTKVLQGFLEREKIYFSESFFALKEAVARQNIQAELAELARGTLSPSTIQT